MSKKLDKLSDTLNKYVKLFAAEFTKIIDDSLLFCMLFFPLVVFIDELKSLKDEERVHLGDAIEAWIRFLLLGGVYTVVAFAICTLLYQVSLLHTKPLITTVSIIIAVVLIIAVPSWLSTKWANKK